MVIYGTFKTSGELQETPRIDFLEIEFPKVPEEFAPEDLEPENIILTCDWDESDWSWDRAEKIGYFRCKGVYVNQRYANGHVDMFENAIIDTMQVYLNGSGEFKLEAIAVVDNEKSVELCPVPRYIEYAE